MSNSPNLYRSIIGVLSILLGIAVIYILTQLPHGNIEKGKDSNETLVNSKPVVIKPGEHDTTLADMGSRPEWSTLDIWQDSITRDDFERLLTEVYTVGDNWKNYIQINDDHAIIRTDTREPDATYRLNFHPFISEVSPNRNWNTAGELSPGTQDKPMAGVHIAIDPGHIGGDYAKIEERWFQIGDNQPVMEGNMTLLTGQLIKTQLEKLGAKVYLVRGSNKPVNQYRPEDYRDIAEAKARLIGVSDEKVITDLQNKYFYRSGEIRARARRVNLAFNPDLVLCLHYNAEAWADPANPSLTKNNHHHVLLHGALTANEVARDDERFEMLVKILQRSHAEEKPIGKYMVSALSKATGLPTFDYSPNSQRAIHIDNISGLWARNLLANRLYQCPVIFLEPYLMNNQEVHDRVQLGNYDGVKDINGTPRKSIYQEYAGAVVEALHQYYRHHRITYKPEATQKTN